MDIEPAAQPGERVPVEIDLGHGEEHALRVSEREIMQDKVVVDAAIYSPDRDAQTGLRLKLGDLIDDPAFADRAVEAGHQRRDQQAEYDGYAHRPLGDARARVLSLRRVRCRVFPDWLFAHQKACPSET